jgi:hypothetical protein
MFLTIFLSACHAFEYTGEGDFTELTRTYVPNVTETKGFMLSLPNFETKQDICRKYKIGQLPEQDDQVYIDLITMNYSKLPTLDEQKKSVKDIPETHTISFKIIDTKTKKVIASGSSSLSDLKATKNRKLMRPFILNLAEISPNSIPKDAELEMEFNYSINGNPLSREMFVVITKRAPTL